MTRKSSDSYVYAGVTRWGGGGSQSAKPDTLGGVFRLRVGDSSWEHMMSGFPDVVHVHCITIHPEANEICFAGSHDGVFRSTDHGATWQRMNFEERNRQIWSIAFDPHDSRRLFAGASPSGVFRSDDGGESWIEIKSGALPDRLPMGTFKNRVMRIAIDPQNRQTICAALEVNGTMSSDDGGATWTDRNDALLKLADEPRLKSQILTTSDGEGMLDVHAICICPTGSRPAFLANRMGIFKSSDNCRTWTDLRVSRYSEYTYGRDIRASVAEPGVLYAALSVSSQGNTGSVARSTDQGETWKRFDHGVKAESTISSIGQHPKRGEIVFFSARRGQVFGTTDAGRTWDSYPLPSGCQGVYAMACG
jgi:photosystem II stability/assembly factor-like uncharacterized protein